MKKDTDTMFLLLVGLLTVAVYTLGLGNTLVFDDARLTDGTIYGGPYGGLLNFKQRMLSYGSFVWVNALAPDNIALQRAVNLALHLATVAALYALFGRLLRLIQPNTPEATAPAGLSPALRAGLVVGTAWFALAPVAVYGVGYLIQRSIVMATLFSALACYAWVRGLEERRPAWLVAAVVSYVAAVLSKEQSFLLAGLSVPLYVFVARPQWQRVALVAGGAGLALAGALAVLLMVYPHLLGRVFDETSQQLVAQLNTQRPGLADQVYPLSVLNQTALFFYYGFLWLVPVVGWMSIDMRPPFPLGFDSPLHLAGALGYVLLLGASVWAVLRRSDVLGFMGLCLLFPLVLFWTEFATVWVQDPMVLYRSYLWAMPLPGLVAVVLAGSGFSNKTLYGFGLAVALVFAALGAERVQSMKTPLTVWTDAIEKIDAKGPANAVGRYRAHMNRGAQYLDRFSADLATTDFRNAQALGEPTGGALFNMGVASQVLKKHADALSQFEQAEKADFNDGPLYYHRGESLLALGRLDAAAQAYTQATLKELPPAVALQSHVRLAEAHMRLGRYAEAAQAFEAAMKLDPTTPRHATGLGMARLGQGEASAALEVFRQVLSKPQDTKNTALAHYGQAMAHAMLKQPTPAREAMAKAVELDPQNPTYRQLQQQWAKEVNVPGAGS